MIDLHSHILPGIDDGAQTLTDTIEMAKAAVDEGITKIIATPHHQNGKYINIKSDILVRTEAANKALTEANIPLTILPGQETRIYGDILEDLQKEEILALNDSNYLFIEMPTGHVPRYAEKLLFDIQMAGLTPIIVHPERNSEIMQNPDILYNLVKKGALTQVTAGSIAGGFGKKIKKLSLDLIEAQQAHFIASDAHNTSSRGFYMTDAYSEISKEFGRQAAYYFKENAELLIENQTVYKQNPERIKKKKFLGIF
ncbi:tyrosine-protein phosphatase [Metabacillus sp. 113a]|uniref:tyrosine-protein phosphatase n=1 Tax=Metabacillus sp. 113a TaxID=3404706 RepID=UPI003CEB6FFE